MHSDLTIGVIGSLAVHRSGLVREGSQLGSRKARVLLALLAVEPGRLVGIDRVVQTLWRGAQPPRRPVQDVATVVSRLRAGLGTRSIVGNRTGYRLGARVRVDLHEAGLLVARAEAGTDMGFARQALNILDRGEALADWPDVDWAEPARLRQTALTRRARHAAGEAALRIGDAQMAQEMAQMAITADPFDEPACRLMMRACATAGQTAQALLTFHSLRGRLRVELGADPAPQTSQLHVAILTGAVRIAR